VTVTGGELPDGTVVNLGGTEFTVGTGSESVAVGQEKWNLADLGTPLRWFKDQKVTVSLALPSTDATLAALALADGDGAAVPLAPAFAAGETRYGASVRNPVSRVTVTATPNHAAAELEWLDGDGNALADADADADGFQLDLAVGDTVLTAKVTASDNTTVRRYTVTVMRAPAPPVPTAGSLVSNTGITGGAGTYLILAQSFETGDNAAGYAIANVQLPMGTAAGRTTVVTIREDDNGAPGGLVTTLANPASLASNALNTFTVPPGTTVELDAETTYWVSVNDVSQASISVTAYFTVVANGDDTGASGWSIGDKILSRAETSSTWTETAASLMLAVNGAAKTAANTAATGAPSVSGAPQAGERLVAGIGTMVDANGLPAFPSAFSFQWVRVTYTVGTNPVQDEAGNGAEALVDETVTNNTGGADTTAPVLVSAVVQARGDTIVLIFDEDLDFTGTDLPDKSAFTVEVDGLAVSVSSVFASSTDRLNLFVSLVIDGNQTVTVSYAKPSSGEVIKDAAGNETEDFTYTEVTNNSNFDFAPSLVSAEVDGTTLVLTYSEELDTGSVPATGDYGVAVDGGAETEPSSVKVSGRKVTLTLTDAVGEEATVTVSYTPGTNPIQDAGGNDAVAFTGRAVSNDTPEAEKGEVRITDGYDKVFDPEDGDAEGRLEVFYKGEYGSVCDDRFDRDFDDPGTPGDTTKVPNQAARLACRWAGFETGAMVSNAGKLAQPLEIWLDDVRCVSATDKHWRPAGSPDPTGLHHCYNAGVGRHNCTPKEDVWLECTGKLESATQEEEAALTATFENAPSSHDGTSAFTVQLALSAPIANTAADLKDNAIEATGATLDSVAQVDGRSDLWALTLTPGGTGAVTVSVDATGACGDPGTLCTSDGNALSEDATTTIAGPAVAPLTVRFEDGPGSHDGSSEFTVDIVFSEVPAGQNNHRKIRNALTVSGGTDLRMTRVGTDKAHRRVTVEPDGDGAVRLSIAPTLDCADANALCTADGGRLESPVAINIPGPDAQTVLRIEPLTAQFTNLPDEHDGSTRFSVDIVFSERPAGVNNKQIREAVRVDGGTKRQMKRVDESFKHRRLPIDPDGYGEITVSLPATTDCAAANALCTDTGGMLEQSIKTTIPGPVAISVADAEVDEGPNAVLAFAVTLDRARTSQVRVDYATEDGTATAGADYTAVWGTLTFAAGERSKTVNVQVLDDAHDDDGETVKLKLSNAVGGRIEDGDGDGDRALSLRALPGERAGDGVGHGGLRRRHADPDARWRPAARDGHGSPATWPPMWEACRPRCWPRSACSTGSTAPGLPGAPSARARSADAIRCPS